MKNTKLIIILLTVFLISSCASVKNTKTVSDNLIGTWKFDNLKLSDTTNCDEISNIFNNSIMVFDENKTFKIKVADFEKTGEWTVGKKGKLLVFGFDHTQNTSNRLKSFDIKDINTQTLSFEYSADDKIIILTFKKI